jgi:hypothetical protein
MESAQLRSDQIGVVVDGSRTCFGRHWELRRIIEPRIVEGSFAMHHEVRDKRIPISGRTESGRRAKVHSSETEGRWNQHGCGFSIRTEGLTIQRELGIEFPRAPTIQHCAHCRVINRQKVRQNEEESRLGRGGSTPVLSGGQPKPFHRQVDRFTQTLQTVLTTT